MAEIFLASAHGPEGFVKEVVIKRIRAHLATERSFVEMFVSEARLASRLNHPNIVQIFDFDRVGDTHYLAMEYVRGRSLAQLLQRALHRGQPPGPMLAAHICLELLRGLGYAHRLTEAGRPLGLVHRDVTPHNVLVSFEGAVKLADFGIAKLKHQATTAGMLRGKLAYMSPEQSRGDPVDARTDLFAVGVTLWEMLTGRSLFVGDSDMALIRAVQQQPIEPPDRLEPGVGAELSRVVMRALERAPEARFQTAQDFENALLELMLQSPRKREDTDVAAFIAAQFPEHLDEIEIADASPTEILPSERLAVPSPGGTPDIGRPSLLSKISVPIWTIPLGVLVVLGVTRAVVPAQKMTVVDPYLPPAASEARAGLPTEAVPPAEKPDPPRALPAPATRPGFLKVTVRPWARLVIDGKDHGEVEGAMKPIPLTPGPHEIRLISPAGSRQWNEVIESGKTRLLAADFLNRRHAGTGFK